MAAVLWMKRYGGHLLVGRLAKNLRLVMPACAGEDEACAHGNKKAATEVIRGGRSNAIIVMRGEASVLGRPGSDLLFQVLRLSTIGAGEFNGRVRDGIGFRLPAKTTKPAKDRGRMSDVGDQMSDVRGHPRSKLISV
jgi:hypothetical protein